MKLSSEIIFHYLDGFLLSIAFLFQSVILNFFIISHYRDSVMPFLWFLADFFCLLSFSYTLFLAYRNQRKRKKREKYPNLSISVNNSFSTPASRSHSRNSNNASNGKGSAVDETFCFRFEVSNHPSIYVSWLFYSCILIAKVCILFKSEIPQTLDEGDFFGPQMAKFAIGCSSLIFTLLIEAFHEAQNNEPLRNAYIKSLSFGTALEILDSVSFLTILIGLESHLFLNFRMENFILALSSINLMLPSVALYKLALSDFGRNYPVPVETIYKVLHLLLVNVPYFGIRVYLWRWFSHDTSIFLIKNVYAIVSFFRTIYPDLKILQEYIANNKVYRINNQNRRNNLDGSLNSGGIERNNLEEIPIKLSNLESTIHTATEGRQE